MDNYEKLYKEALERAKEIIAKEGSFVRVTPVLIESIFPELQKNEGKKIRKALLEMVHDTTGDELWIDYNVHKEDAIAWLEKQDVEMRGVVSFMDVNSETEWDDIHKFLRMNLYGEKVKLLIIREE